MTFDNADGLPGLVYEDEGNFPDPALTMRTIRVMFDDPKYNYQTVINGTRAEIVAYFTGGPLDRGSYPGEDMQYVRRIEFINYEESQPTIAVMLKQPDKPLNKVVMLRKGLRIVAAAIMDSDKDIWAVPIPGRHHDVIKIMREAGYTGPVGGELQGFLLSNGKFCSRKAALHLAEQNGQLLNGKIIGGTLTSEDLW